MQVQCPSCLSNSQERVGQLPESNYYAGSAKRGAGIVGSLFRCRDCHLKYRYPRIPNDILSEFYIDSPATTWSSKFTDRSDWVYLKRWLNINVKKGKVLDVGCFDGALLDALGEEYEKFGVEMSHAAARTASSRGIGIIASDYIELSKSSNMLFDVIIAVDVIEHVANPKAFLKLLQGSLLEGGYIVISTGNFDSLGPIVGGSRYWYCAMPEHLSFIGPKWVSNVTPELGLKISHTRFFCHSNTGLLGCVRGVARAMWKRIFQRDSVIYGPAKDHFMTALQK